MQRPTFQTTTHSVPGLAPDAPFWAVGDIHGRMDLFLALLDQIGATPDPVVLLGDWINKGPDSARVLQWLITQDPDRPLIPLRGNHEELFLRFLRRPRLHARPFLARGGQALFDSFGAHAVTAASHISTFGEVRNRILDHCPGLVDWLKSRPFHYRSGNTVALHAGANPRLPIDAQDPHGFAWGHPLFVEEPRNDDVWVIHGHHPVDQVRITKGRIAVETRASLSAVRISQGAVTVLRGQ